MDAKQKRMLLIGGAVVVLLFVLLRSSSKAAPAPVPITPPAPAPQQSSGSSDMSGLLQAVVAGLNDQATALAKIGQNQIAAVLPNFQALGAESWLSCLPAGGNRPDAACIKAKGGVGLPGLNVSNVKTQVILGQEYTGPYASCKKTDQSYDLQCVGYLLAGSPPFNSVGLSAGTAISTGAGSNLRQAGKYR
jgi:hypothetical protein